jgi:hypothetical protein
MQSQGGPDRTLAQGANHQADFKAALGIAVEDQEPWSRLERERFAQLLNDPSSRGMPRDIEVQDATAMTADDEKAVEDSESGSWNREEVHRGNRFPVISEKGKPSLGRFGISWSATHPSGNGPFGDVEPEH